MLNNSESHSPPVSLSSFPIFAVMGRLGVSEVSPSLPLVAFRLINSFLPQSCDPLSYLRTQSGSLRSLVGEGLSHDWIKGMRS